MNKKNAIIILVYLMLFISPSIASIEDANKYLVESQKEFVEGNKYNTYHSLKLSVVELENAILEISDVQKKRNLNYAINHINKIREKLNKKEQVSQNEFEEMLKQVKELI